MRRSIWIITVVLLLAPLMAVQADPLKVSLTYLGHGQYLFKKQAYDHAGVVQAVQAAYTGEHIDLVYVFIPAGTTLLDRKDICRLRVELQTQVDMHLTTADGGSVPQFCN